MNAPSSTRDSVARAPRSRKPDYLSLRQTARHLELSWSTIIDLVRRGKLEGKLVGGSRWFCSRRSVDAFKHVLRGEIVSSGSARTHYRPTNPFLDLPA
jgi:hypothetical protein